MNRGDETESSNSSCGCVICILLGTWYLRYLGALSGDRFLDGTQLLEQLFPARRFLRRGRICLFHGRTRRWNNLGTTTFAFADLFRFLFSHAG